MAYFSQKDPAWANKFIGFSKSTFKGYGCLLTSISNKLKYDGANLKPTEINEIAKKAGAFKGDLLDMPKLAKALGYTYKKTTTKPSGRHIMETNYYKKVGVPQHFVFIREDGKRIDPIDLNPSWEENNYPTVSWRVLEKIPVKSEEKAQDTTQQSKTSQTAILEATEPTVTADVKVNYIEEIKKDIEAIEIQEAVKLSDLPKIEVNKPADSVDIKTTEVNKPLWKIIIELIFKLITK